jgi:hypothetical protein
MATGETRESAKKTRHLGRNLALVIVALLAISLSAEVESGQLFGTYGCFGPCGTMPYVSSVSCYSVNKTCQIILTGFTAPNVASLKAFSCAFVMIPYDNTTSTVVLSSSPNWNATYVTIPPNSSVPVYCAYPRTPSSGQQVAGSVELSSGQSVEFSGIWD